MRPTQEQIDAEVMLARAAGRHLRNESARTIAGVVAALADDLAEARALLADCAPHVQVVHEFLERTK